MLAIQQLVSGTKSDNAFPGALLPTNNNRAFTELDNVHMTAVVLNNNNDDAMQKKEDASAVPVPVAFALVYRCSPNQLYFSLISMQRQFENGYVNVECVNNDADAENVLCKIPRHSLLKINEIRYSLPDLSGLPDYFSAFAEPLARPLLQCIVDRLMLDCFGTTFNVEFSRNMTVDLYDNTDESAAGRIMEHPDELWRDAAGFLVADRFQHREIGIKCSSLLSALENTGADETQMPAASSSVSIRALCPATRCHFHDYDASMYVMDREEYVDFLLGMNQIHGVVAVDEQEQQTVGYALGLPGRVLQCYADNEAIAGVLLRALLLATSTPPDSEVCMFLRLGNDHALHAKIVPNATWVRRVRRFHTRIVPSNVKWSKVFALNVGAHLF